MLVSQAVPTPSVTDTIETRTIRTIVFTMYFIRTVETKWFQTSPSPNNKADRITTPGINTGSASKDVARTGKKENLIGTIKIHSTSYLLNKERIKIVVHS